MIDVPFYIGELLYENDCVIIPGFGGFVGSYEPAKVHPSNHTFEPPGKKILFNSKLIRDDGLLLDFISQSENISYGEAGRAVEIFIEDLKIKLDSNKSFSFGSLGIFKMDAIGQLEFLPSGNLNFLEDAFGLSAFVSPAIQRKPMRQRQPVFVDRKPQHENTNRSRRIVITSAALVPIILIAVWFTFFNNLNFDNAQNAGVVELPKSSAKNIVKEEIPSNPEQKVVTPIKDLDFNSPAEETKKTIESEEQSISTQNVEVDVPKYYIIGGSFTAESNANNLVVELRKLGYEAKRAGLSRTGNFVVSYFSSPDKSEALMNLAIIRKEHNPSAWILKK